MAGLTIAAAVSLSAAPPSLSKSKQSASDGKTKTSSAGTASDVAKWAATEALVEWQVARVAAACNEVADKTDSAAARREALRFKAAYATSSYAIQAGRSPLVQALDLAAMSKLIHGVWVDDGRAQEQFGAAAQPVISALVDIRKRSHSHSLTYLSERELDSVEGMVESWRKRHAGPIVGEFIRFEAFADELAAELGKIEDLGGMMGRLAGEVNNATYLGERALLLTSRMPRLAEWHAEAAAANVLARQDIATALVSIGQLGELQRTLPDQIKILDSRLGTLPQELAGAVGEQPVLKEALEKAAAALRELAAVETSIRTLDRSVTELGTQVDRLGRNTHPSALQGVADDAGRHVWSHGSALILLASGCMACLLVLRAILHRWSNRPVTP
jgi:hypothetical protein